MLVFKSRVVVTLGLISLGSEARGKPRWEKSVQIYVHQKAWQIVQSNTEKSSFFHILLLGLFLNWNNVEYENDCKLHWKLWKVKSKTDPTKVATLEQKKGKWFLVYLTLSHEIFPVLKSKSYEIWFHFEHLRWF